MPLLRTFPPVSADAALVTRSPLSADSAPVVPAVPPPQLLQCLLLPLLRGPAFLPPRRPCFSCSLSASSATLSCWPSSLVLVNQLQLVDPNPNPIHPHLILGNPDHMPIPIPIHPPHAREVPLPRSCKTPSNIWVWHVKDPIKLPCLGTQGMILSFLV